MAITSLFGPTPQELIAAQVKEQEQMDMLRNQQIAQQGREFGVFAPLYQAGLKFGDLGSRAITRSLFPEVQNPQLQQAQTIQSVIQSYQGQNLGDPTVLQKIASDLFAAGAPDAGIKALATAKSLTTKDEFVTGKPGETIFKKGPGGQLTEVVNIPGKKTAENSLDFARQTMFELAVKDPATLTKEEIAKLNVAREVLKLASAGTTINVGDKSADVAAGKIVGEAQATIDNKYSAITSLKSARALLDKGIYAGPYAPLAQGAAKYSGGLIGDRKKVINTETFLSEIGNTVIPRLQEFGGNDSVEELKYLRDVQGGRIDLEPETLRNILNSAEKKINQGIERLKLQSQAIEKGKPLPLGEVKVPKTPKTTQRTTKSGISYQIIED
jgi:hypothetical protein